MSNKRSERKHALLDTIREEYHLKSDADIARFFNILPSTVCRYRAGLPISADARLAIMRKTGWPLAKLDKLEPPHNRESD